jgi:hypothetical protein
MFLIVEVAVIFGGLFGTYVLYRLLWALLKPKPKPTEPADILQQIESAKQYALKLQREYEQQQQELKEKSAKLDPVTDKPVSSNTQSGPQGM